jgi:hypothetical protein
MRKEYPLHEERRIDNGWDIDLIWCPSQIHKTFTINEKEYKIYLRWRFDDPWEVYVNDNYINAYLAPINNAELYLMRDYKAEEYQELMDFVDDNIDRIVEQYKETNNE